MYKQLLAARNGRQKNERGERREKKKNMGGKKEEGAIRMFLNVFSFIFSPFLPF